jgi:hypothetical protein
LDLTIRATGVEWAPEIPIFWHMYTDYMLYRKKTDILVLFEIFIEPFYTKTCSYFRFEAENVENSVKHIESFRVYSLVHSLLSLLSIFRTSPNFSLFLHPEDGGCEFLRSVDTVVPDYMTYHSMGQ